MEFTNLGLVAIAFALAAIGATISIAISVMGATSAIARQPETAGRVFTIFIIGAAMAEAIGIFGFVLALLSMA